MCYSIDVRTNTHSHRIFSSSAEESSADFLENSLPSNFRLQSGNHVLPEHAQTALPGAQVQKKVGKVTMTSLGRVPFKTIHSSHPHTPHKETGEVTVTSLSPLHIRENVESDPCVGRARNGVTMGVESQTALPQVFRTQLPNGRNQP